MNRTIIEAHDVKLVSRCEFVVGQASEGIITVAYGDEPTPHECELECKSCEEIATGKAHFRGKGLWLKLRVITAAEETFTDGRFYRILTVGQVFCGSEALGTPTRQRNVEIDKFFQAPVAARLNKEEIDVTGHVRMGVRLDYTGDVLLRMVQGQRFEVIAEFTTKPVRWQS